VGEDNKSAKNISHELKRQVKFLLAYIAGAALVTLAFTYVAQGLSLIDFLRRFLPFLCGGVIAFLIAIKWVKDIQ